MPPYATFPVLATAELVLRQLTDADCADVLTISYYNARPATSVAEAATMLHRIHEEYERGESLHWGLADPQTDRIVGTVGYYRGFAGGIGELGCVLKPAFRGRGLMRQAMELAIAFGREQMGLRTIIALTAAQNTPAVKLLERLQFRAASAGEDGEIRYSLC